MKVTVKIVSLIIILSSLSAQAQIKLPILNDSLFSTYYQQRVSHFKLIPVNENDIVFVGNSITDGAEWSELFNDMTIKNRGISGDFSAGILHRIKIKSADVCFTIWRRELLTPANK